MDILDLIYDYHMQKKREKLKPGIQADCFSESVVVTEQKQIVQILTLLTSETKNPIIVKTEREMFDYHSYLKLHAEDSFDDASIFLIIDALDPPIGNVRIKVSSLIILRIFSDKFCFEMKVNMLGVKGGKFKLSMPREIGIQKERRASIRVKIDPKWQIETQGTRMAGMTLPMTMDNISLGGICFYCPEHIPSVIEGLQVDFNILWPSNELELDLTVHIVDWFKLKELGTCRYHTRYRFENYDKTVRSLEGMVTDMQREILSNRKSRYLRW